MLEADGSCPQIAAKVPPHERTHCLWRRYISQNHSSSSAPFHGRIRGFIMYRCYYRPQKETPAETHLLSCGTLTPDHSSGSLFSLEIKAWWHFSPPKKDYTTTEKGKNRNTLTPWYPGMPSYPISPSAPWEEATIVSKGAIAHRAYHPVWRFTHNFSLLPCFSNVSRWAANSL